ncbi:MAG: hypothetical protein ACE5HW_00545 [Candidatus Methanofastidiosia archaeon]
MGLLGGKKDQIIEALKNQLHEMQAEIEMRNDKIIKYEKQLKEFEELKGMSERLSKENKLLLSKLENLSREKEDFEERERKLKQNIEEKNLEIEKLIHNLTAKKEEIQMKLFAIVSKEDDIKISEGLSLTGGLKTDKSVDLGDGVSVVGEIDAGEGVNLGNENVVKGTITGRLIKTGFDCKLKGPIKGLGDVFIGERNVLEDRIDVEGTLEFGDGCEITGEVYSKGKVKLGRNCVADVIVCDNDAIVGEESVVQKVTAGRTVELLEGSRIVKTVEYVTAIQMGRDVHVEGTIKTKR